MEEMIDQIERLLRGQMSYQKEVAFKASLTANENLRSLCFIVVVMTREKKFL